MLDLKAFLMKICESLKPTQITNPTITKTSGNSTLTVRVTGATIPSGQTPWFGLVYLVR